MTPNDTAFDGRLTEAAFWTAHADAMRHEMGQPVPPRETIRDLQPVDLVVGAGAGRKVRR